MKEVIEITQGSTYIFKGKKAGNTSTYLKIKILEITNTTYLIENKDTKAIYRRGISEFNYDFKPIEVIETYEDYLEEIKEELIGMNNSTTIYHIY